MIALLLTPAPNNYFVFKETGCNYVNSKRRQRARAVFLVSQGFFGTWISASKGDLPLSDSIVSLYGKFNHLSLNVLL
jgi:hypothetical protein